LMVDAAALYSDLHHAGVKFYSWDLGSGKAATIEMGNRYAVFIDFRNIESSADELVTVAHEVGHIETGATHTVSSPYDLIEKHEYKANKYAVQRVIPREDFLAALSSGYTEIWSLAEYFNVTEEFMRKAACLYLNGNLASELYM